MKEVPNSGTIVVELDPEMQSKLIQNTLTALRKFSSSRKTRNVHSILSKKIVYPGIFSGTASDFLVMAREKNHTLNKIIFNLYMFDDSLDNKGAVGHAAELEKIQKQIQKEKTYLSDKQIFNLEQLNKDKEEIQEKLLKSIDYIKLVDGIYFAWLTLMANIALEQESLSKPKIVTHASDVLASILKKMYLKVNTKIEPEVHQIIEAMAIYFIRIYYYGESAQYVLKLMEKAFNEDILNAIQKTRVTKFKEFNELSILMKEAQLLPMTPNTFDLQMQKMFGKYGYEVYIQGALSSFITFMANAATPNQLFKDVKDIDQEACERLEILLLNEKKKVKIDDTGS